MWIKFRHQFMDENIFAWKDIGDCHIDFILDELERKVQMNWRTDREIDIQYDIFKFPPPEIIIEKIDLARKSIKCAENTLKREKDKLKELKKLLEKVSE